MHTSAQVRINLKLQKASYFKKRAPNLGHVVKLSNPENISQILEWLIPKNVTEVREVLGIASYCRKFVKDVFAIARTLIHLTKKNAPFKWIED